jgi:hypothetical protein
MRLMGIGSLHPSYVLTCFAPAKVGLVEIIAQGVHKGIQV